MCPEGRIQTGLGLIVPCGLHGLLTAALQSKHWRKDFLKSGCLISYMNQRVRTVNQSVICRAI